MSSKRLLSRLSKQPSVAEAHGYFVADRLLRGGDPISSRMCRLLWRGLGFSGENGRYSGVSIWWVGGRLHARAIYVDVFTGKIASKDLA